MQIEEGAAQVLHHVGGVYLTELDTLSDSVKQVSSLREFDNKFTTGTQSSFTIADFVVKTPMIYMYQQNGNKSKPFKFLFGLSSFALDVNFGKKSDARRCQ